MITAVTSSQHATVGKAHSFRFPDWVSRQKSGSIIVDSEFVEQIGRILSDMIRANSSAGSSPETLVLASHPERLASRGGPTAVSPARIIDLLRRDELDLARLRRILAFVSDEDSEESAADIGFIAAKPEALPQLVFVATERVPRALLDRIPITRWQTADLRHLLTVQEGSISMAGKRRNDYIEDPQELRARLKELVKRIHEEEDPHEMTAYKRFVKQNVSIFARGYLTAYLVKMLVEGEGSVGRSSSSRPRRDRGDRAGRGERTGRGDRTPRGERTGRGDRGESDARSGDDETIGNVAPEDRHTLFVSVGKNRRVYPKDFVALFAEIDGVEGEHIGQIKILDNYSFVDVDKSVSETIIERYNGFDFRGRKLTVNHARAKKE
jgi:hypothetical protein